MRASAPCLLIMVLISCALGCAAERTHVTLSINALKISAYIAPTFTNFSNGKSKLEGEVTVSNKASSPLIYGNKLLSLRVNDELIARTYMDTIASNIIDFDTVEIKPHSTITMPVYWVYSVPKDTVVKSLKLIFNGSGVPINGGGWLTPLPEKGLLDTRKSPKEAL